MAPTILPGATIGILGGGQLGRMTAMAARTLGYDVHVLDPDPDCAAAAWASLAGPSGAARQAVAEQALDLESELSVMIARSPNGDVAVYPPALNFHERQVLSWSMIPAPLPKSLMRKATELARGI